MRRRLLAALGAAAVTLPVAGCGSGDSDALTVWLMDGTAPASWLAELNAAFEAEYDVSVDVEIQQWNGVQDRITTALSENGTVDVLELGNTQTVGFAHTTGLADLSELEGFTEEPWNPAMLESTQVDGVPYAAPWFGASRVVIYDRGIWAEAGAEVPSTRDEWIEALEAIEEHTDAEPIYLPGQHFLVMGGFVADEGGSFAVEGADGGGADGGDGGDAGDWRGALATPEAEAGMDFYAELHSFSTSPTDSDTASPQQSTEVVPNRNVASWIGLAWEAEQAIEAIEEQGREADFGYFPIPGKSADEPGHVLLGGSNLAVSGRAGNPDAARDWLRMATSPEWMEKFVEAYDGGVVPGRTDVVLEPEPDSFAAAMAQSAHVGYLPPLSTGWANVETDPNPIKELMTKSLNGDDFAPAARAADTEITSRINRE